MSLIRKRTQPDEKPTLVPAAPKKRGRPPKGERAMTSAERKAAQRQRDARKVALAGLNKQYAAALADLPPEKILEIRAVLKR